MDAKKVLFIGLTGGMGCGASTVAQEMEKLGAKIINADKTAHRVLNRDTGVKNAIRKNFGSEVFFRNGKINRKLLAQLAFKSQSKTQQLNRIVHPRMVGSIIEAVESARDTGKYPVVGIDAALLYEVNLDQMFDVIIVVSSQMKNRISRIVSRDRLTESEVRFRIDKQLPIEEKTKWADIVIRNNGTLEQLKQKTSNVYKELIKRRRQLTSRQR